MKARTALLLIFIGVIAWVGSIILGVFFGFPYPDASPKEAARIKLYADIAFVIFLFSTTAIIIGIARLLQLRFRSWLKAFKDSHQK